MAKKPGRPKIAGLGYHKNLGQYRKVVKGRSIYFGTDPDQALARYQLYLETGLVWKRGYRQFCGVTDGQITPFGASIEVARRNFAAARARKPSQKTSVSGTEFVVNTVGEVGDAYLVWLTENGKSPGHITQAKQHFTELVNLSECGDVSLENLTISYFKRWYNHCRRMVTSRKLQHNWANRRMRSVKAAFYRCRKEGWLGVALADLEGMIGILQQHAGPQEQQEIFLPTELRQILQSADLQDRAAILIGLNCAVGNTDMGRLKWGDITMRQAAVRTEHIFEQARGKTGRKRRTPLWDLTVEILQQWRTDCRKRGIAVGKDNPVFTTRDGTPVANTGTNAKAEIYRHDALAKRFDKLLNDLKIKRKRLSWYSLRHSAATWATDYAEDGNLVGEGNQFLLGQASDVMWKTYSRGVPPAIRKAVEAIWRGLNDGEKLVLD